MRCRQASVLMVFKSVPQVQCDNTQSGLVYSTQTQKLLTHTDTLKNTHAQKEALVDSE